MSERKPASELSRSELYLALASESEELDRQYELAEGARQQLNAALLAAEDIKARMTEFEDELITRRPSLGQRDVKPPNGYDTADSEPHSNGFDVKTSGKAEPAQAQLAALYACEPTTRAVSLTQRAEAGARVVAYLHERGDWASIGDIKSQVGRVPPDVMRRLQKRGEIERRGETSGSRYRIPPRH